MRGLRFILLLGLLTGGLVWCQETCTIVEKTLDIVTTVRIKTQTENSERVNNPVRWQPVQSIIADGAQVEKGDVLAVFVNTDSKMDLERLLLRQKVIETNLERRLKEIDNKNLDMDDQMGLLKDKLASLESKLERQKSEPTEDDIRVVEGRLRIAKLNLEASRKDYAKAQDRFRREMISRAELETQEKELHENEAKELFARQELEVTKNPPDKAGKIRITEIEIENAKLEIDKLQFEINEQLKIGEIQRKGAVVNKERNAREIREKREDIEKVIVKAPNSGYASLNKFDDNDIVPGTRMWPNYPILEIPAMDSIGFKGILPESRRQFHNENDSVVLRINGRKDKALKGSLKTISTLSHDLAEKDKSGSNQEKKFGVKVFDITIQLDDDADWLRPGMYGEAEIHSERKLTGPVVPLNYVRLQEGKAYLSLDGVYREVTGTQVGADYLLDDRNLMGKTVGLHGVFAVAHSKKGEEEKRLMATGEILPVKSVNIAVPQIGWWPWPKITWLVPEESMVKAGDVVAKLDPEERIKQLRTAQESLTENLSTRDELEKKVEITRRNAEFKEKNTKNKLDITRVESEETLKLVPPLAVYQAEENLKLAEIKLQDQKRKLEREMGKKVSSISPAELRKMKRELERCQLKVVQCKLKLETAREGKTPVEKSKARLNLAEAQDAFDTAQKQGVYDNLAIVREFERRKHQLRWHEKNVARITEQVENHVIHAPQDGLICYNKIYNNGSIVKVATGRSVGPRFNILSIPELSNMELKVEVEEKYYSSIRKGMEVEVKIPSLVDKSLVGVVTGIDLLFRNRAKKDNQLGLYSSHEPLGEVVFNVRVRLKTEGVVLKPGLIGEVLFPVQR